MRLVAAWVAAVSCCLSFGLSARAAPRLELEVGAGSTQGSGGAPALDGRVGADFQDHLTLSLRFVGLGNPRESGLQGSVDTLAQGFSAWAAMAEVRAHTSGTFQLSIAGGLGLGLTPGIRCVPGSGAQVCTNLTPYEQAGLGARLLLGDLFVSADAAVQLWNGWSGDVRSFGQQAPDTAWQNPGRLGTLLMLGIGGRANVF